MQHGRLAFLLFLSFMACSKDTPKADTTQPASTASIKAAESPASATAAKLDPGPLPPMNMASIPERFSIEQMQRPTGTPRAEDAFAAFEKEGATLKETRQHLASPFKAQYCVGTKTGNDVNISVCEYKDEATAKEGRDMSLKAFGNTKRDIWMNKSTTLTIRRGDDGAADKALQDKLVAAFQKLEAPKTPSPPPATSK
jgi:hypothetical protein